MLHPRKAPGPDGLGAGRGGQLVKLLLNASCFCRIHKETTITPVHEGRQASGTPSSSSRAWKGWPLMSLPSRGAKVQTAVCLQGENQAA